jgi:hypothetical protein
LTPAAGSSFDNSHTASTPAFDVFIAIGSLFQTEPSLFLIQQLIAPFAAMMLIGVYVLAKKLTSSTKAALIALMASSAYGPFVLVTQAAWKECIGISMLPFLFLTFIMRREPKMRMVSTLLLLMMPFVHHLIALIAVLSIASFSSASLLMARKARRVDSVVMMDVFVSIISIVSMTAYYIFMNFDRLEYLTPDKGLYLFLGLAVLTAIGVYLISSRAISASGRRLMTATVAGGLILILAINFLSPLGTVDSDALWAISLPMMAIIAIVLFGICGISVLASSSGETKTFYFSMISAPFAIIIYALLRADDLLSLDMITRTVDMLDIGLMVAAGTYLVYKLKERTVVVSTAAISFVCVLLLLTVPFALSPEKYAGTRNDIYPYEVDAMNWSVEMAQGGGIDTDEHFAYADVLYNTSMSQTLVKRIDGVLSFQQGSTLIASERWVTIGVKDMPYGWMKINETKFEFAISNSNQLYLGGPVGVQVIVLKVPVNA